MRWPRIAVYALLYGVLAAILVALGYCLYVFGGMREVTHTVKAAQKAQTKANAKTRADLGRAATVGQSREQSRQTIDSHFRDLESEAAHAPIADDDSYVLPAERLRIWREANAGGPDRGPAAGEPDNAAVAAAAAGVGPHRGPGIQSPGGGEGLSPARLADLPSAGLPADQERGL